MCDLSNVVSLQNVTKWLDQIYQRSNMKDCAILVLANKCDLLERINQSVVCKLETDIEEMFP